MKFPRACVNTRELQEALIRPFGAGSVSVSRWRRLGGSPCLRSSQRSSLREERGTRRHSGVRTALTALSDEQGEVEAFAQGHTVGGSRDLSYFDSESGVLSTTPSC